MTISVWFHRAKVPQVKVPRWRVPTCKGACVLLEPGSVPRATMTHCAARMRRITLAWWLLATGAAVWFSGAVRETPPAFARLVVPAVLIFGAFAARPPRS